MNIDIKDINKLYIACRESFKEYYADLRATSDDKQFLMDALQCEVCANAISLCIELYYGLTDSPGMETSCRSILEAWTLREMVINNELDDEQLANFKHQSALLFYGNIFDTAPEEKDRLFNDKESAALKKKIHWIVEDYERAMEAYRQKYGSKLDERASRDAIREGLFFTTKNPSKVKSFTTLFNGHLKKIDTTGTLYKRVSFFAHPWFVDNIDDFNEIRSERFKDIKYCFGKIQGFFADQINKIPDDATGIDEDVSAMGECLPRSQIIEKVCSSLCTAGEGPFTFTTLCYAFLRDLLTEMNILIGLGYYEMALSKFQAVCEFWGMNALLNSVDDPVQFKNIHQIFDYSTRVQLHGIGPATPFFANVPLKDPESIRNAFVLAPNELDISFDDYCKRINADSRSFLNVFFTKERISFIDIVRLSTDIMFPDGHALQKVGFVEAYLFSIDVHHATGFCYTENRGCWELLSHTALRAIYEALWIFVSLTGLFTNTGVKPFLQALTELMNEEQTELNRLSLKYPE